MSPELVPAMDSGLFERATDFAWWSIFAIFLFFVFKLSKNIARGTADRLIILLLSLLAAYTVYNLATEKSSIATFRVNKADYMRKIEAIAQTPGRSRFLTFTVAVDGGGFVGATTVIRLIIYDESDEINRSRQDLSQNMKAELKAIDGENCRLKVQRHLEGYFYAVDFVCP
jgi:hypothetical protein